ncbi:hypothetical protein [Hymenobacter antarcticus]
MSKKDNVAYAVFSMVAMCCYFAGKEAFGFFGSIFGMMLGMFAGLAALRLIARRSLRFGAYALGIVTVVGLSALYGLVRLSDRAVTVANLQGRWVADNAGGPVTLHIRDSTAMLDMEVFTTPHRFVLVVAHDSLRMTSPTTMRFAWRVHTLTTTRMNISAKQGVLDFQREDN